MPRPTTKDELLAASARGYETLLILVDSLPPDRLTSDFTFEDRDRNVHDVLAHLHEWHRMMRTWHDEGMAGAKPAIPAEGYTWRTTPELNERIRTNYLEMPLTDVRAALDTSHADILGLISRYGDDELFTKRRYPWTGSTSLGAYLISASSSHYDWAAKKIRRHAKAS